MLPLTSTTELLMRRDIKFLGILDYILWIEWKQLDQLPIDRFDDLHNISDYSILDSNSGNLGLYFYLYFMGTIIFLFP